jgi:mRNA degradation ribonuclease J1/J2
MKRILILTIGCSLEPWSVMAKTSQDTWDSVKVDGIDTVFYFGSPVKPNTDKEIYFDIEESYFSRVLMGPGKQRIRLHYPD